MKTALENLKKQISEDTQLGLSFCNCGRPNDAVSLMRA